VAIHDITAVSELRRDRFSLTTDEGLTWGFIGSTTVRSGMLSGGVHLTNSGNAPRFFLSLQRALGHSASLAAWAESRIPGRPSAPGSDEPKMVKTHAVPVIDGAPAPVALCGKRAVGPVEGTFDAAVPRCCRPCGRSIQLDREAEANWRS
jgi:hypothetical protein